MRRERSCCDQIVRERARHRILQQHLVGLQAVPVNGLDLRRVEIHGDDADHQKHTEDDVQNRDAGVIRGAGGQVSPFSSSRTPKAKWRRLSQVSLNSNGELEGGRKRWRDWHYQSTLESGTGRGVWHGRLCSWTGYESLEPQRTQSSTEDSENNLQTRTFVQTAATAGAFSGLSSGSGLRDCLRTLS